jgi:NAD(P)H dehydrogenase (quinone)
MTKLAVIYYSATGHGTSMANRVAAAAEAAGAEVRVRHVAETRDPESFAQNPAWTANYAATKDLPQAGGDDIVWADAVIFGISDAIRLGCLADAQLPRLARWPVV